MNPDSTKNDMWSQNEAKLHLSILELSKALGAATRKCGGVEVLSPELETVLSAAQHRELANREASHLAQEGRIQQSVEAAERNVENMRKELIKSQLNLIKAYQVGIEKLHSIFGEKDEICKRLMDGDTTVISLKESTIPPKSSTKKGEDGTVSVSATSTSANPEMAPQCGSSSTQVWEPPTNENSESDLIPLPKFPTLQSMSAKKTRERLLLASSRKLPPTHKFTRPETTVKSTTSVPEKPANECAQKYVNRPDLPSVSVVTNEQSRRQENYGRSTNKKEDVNTFVAASKSPDIVVTSDGGNSRRLELGKKTGSAKSKTSEHGSFIASPIVATSTAIVFPQKSRLDFTNLPDEDDTSFSMRPQPAESRQVVRKPLIEGSVINNSQESTLWNTTHIIPPDQRYQPEVPATPETQRPTMPKRATLNTEKHTEYVPTVERPRKPQLLVSNYAVTEEQQEMGGGGAFKRVERSVLSETNRAEPFQVPQSIRDYQKATQGMPPPLDDTFALSGYQHHSHSAVDKKSIAFQIRRFTAADFENLGRDIRVRLTVDQLNLGVDVVNHYFLSSAFSGNFTRKQIQKLLAKQMDPVQSLMFSSALTESGRLERIKPPKG